MFILFYRNLFFRTSSLLLVGAIPIFVLEGEAPQLKQIIMEKRININNNKAPTNNKIVRKRLNLLQKQVSTCIDNIFILKMSKETNKLLYKNF